MEGAGLIGGSRQRIDLKKINFKKNAHNAHALFFHKSANQTSAGRRLMMSNDSSDETVSSFLHLLECARVCADVAAPFVRFFVFFSPFISSSDHIKRVGSLDV